MRANVKKVYEAWLAGTSKKGDSKATVWTDGTTVYSYSLPIARKMRGRFVVLERERAKKPGGGISPTTRSQIDAIRTQLKIDGHKVSFVEAVTATSIG